MWYEDLPPGGRWSFIWNGYIICARCEGIRQVDAVCPACGADPYLPGLQTVRIEGRDIALSATFMGAEGRIEDNVYLQMLQREWERPATEFDQFVGSAPDKRPAVRAGLVLVFWTYFESRIERLLRSGMRAPPEAVSKELLERHSGIGQRLGRLYKIIFATTYFEDLVALGFEDVARMLSDIQSRRNKFAHGSPNAIDDILVESLVASLKREHEAWVAVFNKRIAEASYRSLK